MLSRENFEKNIVPQLKEKLGRTNPMSIPRLEKIIVNSCLAEAVQNSKILDVFAKDLAQITGQKPKVCRAKKAIAAFKLREGLPIALKCTLRKERMYEFFSRFVNTALPRSRDFKGLSKKGFDGRGNYSVGVTEHIIFPEIETDKVDKNRGFNITFVTTARNNEEGEILLRTMGLPLRR